MSFYLIFGCLSHKTSRVASACTAYGKPELGEEINKKLEGYYADYVKYLQPDAK